MKRLVLRSLVAILILFGACASEPIAPAPNRKSLVPASHAKVTPAEDSYPPKSHSADYGDPVPLPYPINTAGAEDSAFVLPSGRTLYFWFTPDPQKTPEQQVNDRVTGIYVSHRVEDAWGQPERVVLQDAGKLALDGCEFVLDERIWFCSARDGRTGVRWYTAELKDGRWRGWRQALFDPSFEVGELHITTDGRELYFHSRRAGGRGDYDIWVSRLVGGAWGPPENVAAVNSPGSDGWPFVSPDGSQLWFTRMAGAPELWRSRLVEGTWRAPERMFSGFAGEASMDSAGNVYFTHHFFKDGSMVEADIYVARPVVR